MGDLQSSGLGMAPLPVATWVTPGNIQAGATLVAAEARCQAQQLALKARHACAQGGMVYAADLTMRCAHAHQLSSVPKDLPLLLLDHTSQNWRSPSSLSARLKDPLASRRTAVTEVLECTFTPASCRARATT